MATVSAGEVMSVEGIGRDLAVTPALQESVQQVAALCYRIVHKHVQILLVTSRDTGRWILPKGWPIPGLSFAQSAAREAREEAGVRGAAQEECVGHLSYQKVMADQSAIACDLAVYPLRVESLASRYPERNQRRRKWVSLDQAADMLQEPEARQVLADFALHPSVQRSPKLTATG